MSNSPESDTPEHEIQPRSSSSNAYVLIFGCIMLVGLLFLAWLGRSPRSTAIGEPLPRLDLQPLVHAEQRITNQDLHGKLTVLHFWGTWCPPCLKEFPEFVKLASEFDGNDDVAIISVSCSGGPEYDLDQLQQKTIDFYQKFPNSIPTYSDSAAMTRQQLALLLPNGSFGYPTTLLVGPDGKILKATEGYLPGDMEKLAKTIKSQL